MDAKPHFLMGLREAVEALRGGRLRSEDLTRALLERIAAHEGRVGTADARFAAPFRDIIFRWYRRIHSKPRQHVLIVWRGLQVVIVQAAKLAGTSVLSFGHPR